MTSSTEVSNSVSDCDRRHCPSRPFSLAANVLVSMSSRVCVIQLIFNCVSKIAVVHPPASEPNHGILHNRPTSYQPGQLQDVAVQATPKDSKPQLEDIPLTAIGWIPHASWSLRLAHEEHPRPPTIPVRRRRWLRVDHPLACSCESDASGWEDSALQVEQ